MNISNNIYQANIQQVNFQGSVLDKALCIIPNTKVSKNLTPMDVIAFESYVKSIPYRMKSTQEELSNLLKLDGEDFLLASYLHIANKLGFSEKIRPYLQPVEQIQNEAIMAYMPLSNTLLFDVGKIKNTSKESVYALLRHEFQHFIQNISALRHETIGVDVIDGVLENYRKYQYTLFENIFKNLSESQISEIYKEQPELLRYIQNAKHLYDSGDIESYSKLFDADCQIYKESLLDFQKKVINELGVIPKDSAMSAKIKKDFDEMYSCGYYNADATIDYVKYFKSGIEQDAISAQTAAELEWYPKDCGVNLIKEATIEDLKNNERLKNASSNKFLQV